MGYLNLKRKMLEIEQNDPWGEKELTFQINYLQSKLFNMSWDLNPSRNISSAKCLGYFMLIVYSYSVQWFKPKWSRILSLTEHPSFLWTKLDRKLASIYKTKQGNVFNILISLFSKILIKCICNIKWRSESIKQWISPKVVFKHNNDNL